jgi:exopolysaccharide biosynthesis polyprenyl glycosylphosphotransferase
MLHGELCPKQPAIVNNPKLPAAFFSCAGDVLAILILPLAASLMRQGTENLERNLCFWTLLSAFTALLIASHGGYRQRPAKYHARQAGLAVNCFLATSIAMLSLAVLLGHAHILTRRWTVADLAITPVLLCCERAFLNARLAAVPAFQPHGTLVVCYDHCPRDLRKAFLERDISPGVAGVLYLSQLHEATSWHGWPEVPSLAALLETIRANNIRDVVFMHHPELDSFTAQTAHQELLADLLAFPARIWMAFDVTQNLPPLIRRDTGSCQLIPIVTDDLVTSRNHAKRAFDIIGSLCLLLLTSPLLLLSALLVRLSSPGPVIFRQLRTGAHGQTFPVLKFRTMTYDPNRQFAQAQRGDRRVTRIGRFLRRTSLDELLQLINVIRGEMSLVGPRPHAPETKVEGISFENALRMYHLRHRVKPGITGLAQIRGQRGETPAISALEQRLDSDLEYIQSWSLWLDISILLQTIPTVLSQKNAW